VERPLSAVRNTCFAILSAVESDVRDAVAIACLESEQDVFLPEDVRQRALGRLGLDSDRETELTNATDLDLLKYTDFGDLAKILHATAKVMLETIGLEISVIAKKLESLAKARNRVCHSRPLEEEDLPNFLDLAKFLLTGESGWDWTELRGVQNNLDSDPSYILRLQIPEFWRYEKNAVPNNLPLPDYDETSFLGREIDRKHLKNHLVGRHPVITLVGEGGVGKTALALQCVYGLLDLADQCPYEAIVWTSLKNKVLTASGINSVHGGVANVLGILQESTNQLGVPTPQTEVIDAANELLAYLKEIKVLLIIDNFETLTANPLREFFSNIPEGSKVLITSRVGLGEIELRYALDPLDMKTASTLLRKYASVFNLPTLSALPQPKLERYVNFLFRNPLLIKWFVQSVAAGADQERTISRNNLQFSDAIRFCFENLFDRLSAVEKEVLHILAASRRQLTFTELMFLIQEISKTPPINIESALSTLHSSSMVKRTAPEARSADVSTRLNLTDIAAEYIGKFAPPSGPTMSKVQAALKKLRETTELASVQTQIYKYDIMVVRSETKDERICTVYLNQALGCNKRHEYDEAVANIEKVYSILPSFSEAYRVASIVAASQGDLYRAAEELDRALEHSPQSALIYYQYAQLSLYKLEDAALALEKIDAAIGLDQTDDTLQTFRALALVRLGRCQEASEIYEKLLPSINDRARKWKITTRDQAAECYRRWAEHGVRMKETDRSKGHLVRALEILEGAIANADFDYRMGNLYRNIVEDALFLALSTSDSHYAEAILNKYADASMVELISPFERFTVELLSQIFADDRARHDAIRTRLDAAFMTTETVVPDIDGSGDLLRLRGKVKGPLNSTFGFISFRGQDWFFHRSDLANPLEWPRIVPNAFVIFQEGRDKKGKVKAINVSLAE
jgi:LuxR family glucitol operon transcriptional activator